MTHKSRIIQVGTVVDRQPVGWIFDGEGHPEAVGLSIGNDTIRYSGYTVEELREIADKLEGPQRRQGPLTDIEKFAAAVANLRREWWLMWAKEAERVKCLRWFAYLSYLKARDAAREERRIRKSAP